MRIVAPGAPSQPDSAVNERFLVGNRVVAIGAKEVGALSLQLGKIRLVMQVAAGALAVGQGRMVMRRFQVELLVVTAEA